MHITSRNTQTFSWIGDGCETSQRRRTERHYRSFKLDNIEFQVDDFVLIRNDDQIDPEDISNCYVAQIKDLYEIDDKDQPHQAKVTWFSRVLELPTHTLKYFDELHDYELVEEHRSHWSNIIDAETIFAKCSVMYLPVNEDISKFTTLKMKRNSPLFFCRYNFSGTKLEEAIFKETINSPILHSTFSSKSKTKSEKTPKSSKKKSDSSKELYCAMDTGTSEYPKILIKRLEDQLHESPKCNTRNSANSFDDILDSIRSNLIIDSSTKRSKNLLNSESQDNNFCSSFTPSRGKAKRALFTQVSSSKNFVLESSVSEGESTNENLKKNLVKSKSFRALSKFSDKSKCNLASSQNNKSESNLHCLKQLKKEQGRDCHENLSSPQKFVRKSIASQTISTSAINLTDCDAVNTTPRKSARLDKALCNEKSDSLQSSCVKNSNTPTRCCLKKNKDKSIPLSKSAIKISSANEDKLLQKDGNNITPKKFVLKVSKSCIPKTQSLRKSISIPSPKKNFSTPKKTLQFVDEKVAFTRSGRKVKPVNYFIQENFGDTKTAMLFSPEKKKPLSRWIRRNYSDDSDSESVYSMSEERSSSDEDKQSDCSLLDEKCEPLQKKKTSKVFKASGKNKKLNLKRIIPPKKTHSEILIPKRKTPLKVPQNILEESRLRLHVSAIPNSLPCREEEYSDIYSFVKGCLSSHTGGCMYISGVPGTGKTATVHEVIRNLEEEKKEGEIPLFTFVEVNGMWMTDPYQCYVHIHKALTGKAIASQQAANLLEKRFTEPGPKKDAIVLLVDELDRLWTRKQTVMYNIFDWPSRKNSKLIVLAIANTMDLPERLMMNRISSRLGLTRKTFQPYNFKQLQQIIMSRIQELKVFDPDAVQLVARKVAAVSGDARRALDICRHATEVAENNKSSPRKKQKILVGMEHVDVAIQQMFSSPVIAAVKCSSEMAKLFLKIMLSEFTRTGSEETTLMKVSNQIVASCRFEGLQAPNESQLYRVCSHLVSSHLILVDNFRNDIHMRLRLSVSPDDVNYALTGKNI